MKSFFGDKVWIILLVFGAFVAIVILASGLGEMEFGQPFVTRLERNNTFDYSDFEPGSGSRWFRYLIPAMLLVMYLLMLGPVRPQRGISIAKAVFRAIGFILFLTLVLGAFARQGGFLAQEALEGLPLPGESAPGEFAPPTLTSGSTLGTTLLLIFVVGILVVFIVNRAFDRFYRPPPGMDEIAEIARTALTGLSDGEASKNVIIRCYLDMNRMVGEKRGLVRENASTPAEFAGQLARMGLPRGAVDGLTGVFERVRYGGKEADANEIEEAKRCLTLILRACEMKV